MLVIPAFSRDRTNRLLFFRDRISNCTNLFRPEPNRITHTQIHAGRRGRPPTLRPRCRWSYGGRNFKGHRDSQVSYATVLTRNWSSCYLCMVDGMTALCRRLAVHSGAFRRQITVVEIIIGDLHSLSNGRHCVGPCVRVTVAVHAVCASEQCTCEMRSCMISYSDSLQPSALLSGYITSTANAAL